MVIQDNFIETFIYFQLGKYLIFFLISKTETFSQLMFLYDHSSLYQRTSTLKIGINEKYTRKKKSLSVVQKCYSCRNNF